MQSTGYSRLADHERFYIKTHLDQRDSLRTIAEGLKRSPSSISREIRRNSDADGCYCPDAAGRQARHRRKSQAPPPAMNATMRFMVGCALRQRMSPEQITGTWRRYGVAAPCPNTIRKELRQGRLVDGDWKSCLRHRGRPRKKAGADAYPGQIPDRTGIEDRPSVVDARVRLGDFEADLIVGKGRRGCFLTVVERRTGLLLAAPLKRKTARETARALIRLLRPHKDVVKTITFDNGREFSWHRKVARTLDCETYFARPYHSWEKGGIENANGLIRDYFPKAEPLDRVSKRSLDAVVEALNHRPRKRLGWDSPSQAFAAEKDRTGQTELWCKADTGVLR